MRGKVVDKPWTFTKGPGPQGCNQRDKNSFLYCYKIHTLLNYSASKLLTNTKRFLHFAWKGSSDPLVNERDFLKIFSCTALHMDPKVNLIFRRWILKTKVEPYACSTDILYMCGNFIPPSPPVRFWEGGQTPN